LRYAERAGIESEIHFQYYVKHPDCVAQNGRYGRGRLKERDGSMSQYGTMHVTGNITPEMPRVLARGVARRGRGIDCEKEER